jgi:hypothetical protein
MLPETSLLGRVWQPDAGGRIDSRDFRNQNPVSNGCPGSVDSGNDSWVEECSPLSTV